ncbi:MAG: recombinase family protein [Bacteroidaceae bacterium]|nr:recombinase family protein [Bacteroidaceae bacterium]
MMEFMYIRCSTKDQNEARQVAKAKELGIDDRHIFIEKASGKDFDRPVYQGMKNATLREGDVLYIDSLDRLGRNYEGIVAEWQDLTKKLGVDIVVLDMPLLDTRKNKDLLGTFISDIVLQLLSYVAENEREKIRTRQREGIEEAKAAGKYKGRKPVEVNPYEFEKLVMDVKAKKRTATSVMNELGLTRTTFYKLVGEWETKTGRFEE